MVKRIRFTKKVYLVNIGLKDAKYILKLRLNKNLAKYLNKTSRSVDLQKKWLKEYLKRNLQKKEYYFKFQIKNKKKFTNIGLGRIIDLGRKNFSFGSWIIEEGFSKLLSIECVLSMYKFAFEKLKYKNNKMWMDKRNKKIILFHEAMGAKKEKSDKTQVYYNFNYKNYITIKSRFIYFFR